MRLPLCLLLFSLRCVTGVLAQEAPAPPSELESGCKVVQGPWGELEYFYFYLEAPDALIERYPLPSTITRWAYPRTELQVLGALLQRQGLSNAQAAELVASAQQHDASEWIFVFPSLSMLDALSPETRSSLYNYLGQFAPNAFQQSPIYFPGDSVALWAQDSNLSHEIVSTIQRWTYRRGDILAFSDVPALLNLAKGERAARELYRRLTRTRTIMPRLVLRENTNVSSILDYWTTGLNLRKKEIEPMLRSIQHNKEARHLDITHLLPALARKLLFTYPDSEMFSQGLLPDCHWTTLNFFNYATQNYYLTQAEATSAVLENFERVDPPYRFGDVLMFIDRQGSAIHSCNYIAADLVFTKNGRTPAMPWVLMELADQRRMYGVNDSSGTRIQGFRHKKTIAAGK